MCNALNSKLVISSTQIIKSPAHTVTCFPHKYADNNNELYIALHKRACLGLTVRSNTVLAELIC